MSEVEVDEVLGFWCEVSRSRSILPSPGGKIRTVGHEASKVSSDNAVPCGTLSLVKCSLDVLGNVLTSVVSATTADHLGRKGVSFSR